MNDSATLSHNAPAQPAVDATAAGGMACLDELASRIKAWGRELGFGAVGIADIDLKHAEPALQAWLDAGCHGDMDYMAIHGMKRARPAELVSGTMRVISARLDYLPSEAPIEPSVDWRAHEWARQAEPPVAVVSLYARGRDYHKVVRQRLQQLADRIAAAIGPFGYRVFSDSAPVLEVELAQRAGIGWRGKHTLLLSRNAGSMFFLGEIFVDVPLPVDPPQAAGDHCGQCTRCLDVCPTRAIVAPYRVDARRCISYLTIEHKGAIPEDLRAAMGNRIYGCDDCQLVCPWNKFAQTSPLPDFAPRNGLQSATLIELFGWSEADFLTRLEGSAIRRLGHERWLRNIAVALGNALRVSRERRERDTIRAALAARAAHPSALVREHVAWALAQGREPGDAGDAAGEAMIAESTFDEAGAPCRETS